MFISVALIKIDSSSSKSGKSINRSSPETIQKANNNSSSNVDNGGKRIFRQAEKTAKSTTTL
jgi:hypothetical protein